MHSMLKRMIFFLILAFITGALGLSNVIPILGQTFQGLSLISVVLVMFFAVAYSLRGDESKT